MCTPRAHRIVGGEIDACHRLLDRGRGVHRGDVVLGPGSVEGRILTRGARPFAGRGGCGYRGPLPVRADGPLAPPPLPARQDPGGLDPRAVVEPVVVGPDDRGPGGRGSPSRSLSVLDLW